MQTHTASSRNRKTFELGSVFTSSPRCSRHRLRTASGGPRGLHPRGTDLMRRCPFRDDPSQRGAPPTRLFLPPRRRLGRPFTDGQRRTSRAAPPRDGPDEAVPVPRRPFATWGASNPPIPSPPPPPRATVYGRPAADLAGCTPEGRT